MTRNPTCLAWISWGAGYPKGAGPPHVQVPECSPLCCPTRNEVAPRPTTSWTDNCMRAGVALTTEEVHQVKFWMLRRAKCLKDFIMPLWIPQQHKAAWKASHCIRLAHPKVAGIHSWKGHPPNPSSSCTETGLSISEPSVLDVSLIFSLKSWTKHPWVMSSSAAWFPSLGSLLYCLA